MDWLLGDGNAGTGDDMEYADAVSDFISWNFQYDVWLFTAVSRTAAFETGTFFDFAVHGIGVCHGLLDSVPGGTAESSETGRMYSDVCSIDSGWEK